MNIIEKAVCLAADKFLEFILGKPHFSSAPAQDDWPPDGSMHFLRFDQPAGFAGLPSNAVQYEFSANVGEDDPKVFELGQEIISHLCNSRQTLITATFDPELPKYKRRKGAAPPSESVARFLRSLAPEVSIAQRENIAAFLFAGCPKKLFLQDQTGSNMPSCFIHLYLFSEEAAPPCPEEGLSRIEHGEYQAGLCLGYGPNALNIVFDSKAVDISEVEKVIEDVCRSHHIPLINPPALS